MNIATRLYPSQNARNNNSFKYKVNCQSKLTDTHPDTKDWLELLRMIPHSSPDYKLYESLLEKTKAIVVKVGPASLQGEFTIAKQLETLSIPTFLHYHCMFQCLEDFRALQNSSKYLCKETGDRVTVLVMPHIQLGQVGDFTWDRSNFPILKNLLKHIVASLFLAYREVGFIHQDLHLGNILMKRSTRKEISYGDYGILPCLGYIPVILDFDRSVLIEPATIQHNQCQYLVYRDIEKYMGLLQVSMKHIRIDTSHIINSLSQKNTLITKDVLKSLWKEIDAITIRYLVSEIPPMPSA